LALGLVLLLGGAGAAMAMSEQDFLKHAIEGDNSEIQLGRLAASKGGTASVKSFAQTLITDHSKARQEAAAVAQRLGVAPPQDVAPEARQEYDKLQKLSGASFDKEFSSYMVSDHEKDISEFKAEAGSGSGAAANLASKQLPTLEKHLAMAKALEGGK
jgi:putative membrane protein